MRVAVASNGDVWCVDARDALWLMRGTVWSRIDVPNERVRDVDVARDGTVYLVMANGRYYSIVPGGTPFFHGVFITVHAIAGVGSPSDVDPFGLAWGVSPTFGDGALCRCRTINGWSDTNIRNVVDLSVARDGAVWMTKSDGTSWITTDGVTQLRMGTLTGLVRLAAHSFAVTLAVASDGTAWSWRTSRHRRQSNRHRRHRLLHRHLRDPRPEFPSPRQEAGRAPSSRSPERTSCRRSR